MVHGRKYTDREKKPGGGSSAPHQKFNKNDRSQNEHPNHSQRGHQAATFVLTKRGNQQGGSHGEKEDVEKQEDGFQKKAKSDPSQLKSQGKKWNHSKQSKKEIDAMPRPFTQYDIQGMQIGEKQEPQGALSTFTTQGIGTGKHAGKRTEDKSGHTQ